MKQPDETDAQASFSSDRPLTALATEPSPDSADNSVQGSPELSGAAESPVPVTTSTEAASQGVAEPHTDEVVSDAVEPAAANISEEDPSVSAAGDFTEAEAAAVDDVTPDENATPDEDIAPTGDVTQAGVQPDTTGTADVAADDYAGSAPDVSPDVSPGGSPDVTPAVVSDESTTATQEEDSPIAQHDGVTIGQEEDDSPIARELADLTARRKALEAAEVQLTGRTRVLTVSNQKGGVGKTTTTVNLAAALAERGARVLVIDLDPQGNASTALGVPHTSDIPSVYDVLIDEFPLADIIQVSPESPNLLCAPSTIHLAGAEIELVSQVAREHRLRVAVDDYLAKHEGQLDFILIDCPPSLGLLTINAFTAATELLIPIQCEYYALEGLSQLLGTVRMIQKHLNPRLQLSTIMLTMYDGRTRLAQQVADEVREHFPKEVLETIIPRSVRVSEAPSFGQSVLAYDGQSAGAIAYREAAVEMIRRDSASNERGV